MLKTLAVLAFCLALPLCAGQQAPGKPININAASVTELMQLPKIGQKTAESIVSFRKQHGNFKRTEEIMNVKGIGEKTYSKLKPYLTLGANGIPSNP